MIQTTSPVAKARTEQAECWPGPRGYSDAPQATSLSSCCIVVFPTDSDIQHCGAEVIRSQALMLDRQDWPPTSTTS